MKLTTKYTKEIRKIAKALLFTTLFAAAVSFALILARGNTITEQGITATGTIRLGVESTNGLQAFLDEQSKNINSNKTINSILPGKYSLRIQRDGYSSWQQEVQVFPGLVTDVTVQLFPNEMLLQQLSTRNVNQVFFDEQQTIVYYTVTDSQLGTNVGLWQKSIIQGIIPLIEEQEVKISNFNQLIRSAALKGQLDLQTSPSGEKLLLKAGSSYYLLDASTYNEPDADNLLEVGYPIDQINWLRDSNNLLIQSGNVLIDYDIFDDRSTIITFLGEAPPVYDYVEGVVTFIENDQLYTYSNGKRTLVELDNIELPADISKLSMGSEDNENIVLDDGVRLYFLNTDASYLKLIGAYQLITISPSGRNLLVEHNGIVESISINISEVRNAVDTTSILTQVPSGMTDTEILWATNSGYFVYRNPENPQELIAADVTGNNLQSLINSENLTMKSFTVLSDNSGMVISLIDDLETSVERVSLYKLDFKLD